MTLSSSAHASPHASPHPFPTLHPPFLIFHRAKLPHSPEKQLTSFADSFGYVDPEVIKNTGPRESHRSLVDRYDHFHTPTQTGHKLIILSAQTSLLTLSSVATPFSCRQHHCPCPAQCQPQNWVWESVLESHFWSCQVLYPTSHRSRPASLSHRPGGIPRPFAYHHPPPWHHSHIINLFPTLRQNWGPRAKWHSALTSIREEESTWTKQHYAWFFWTC